MVCYLLARLTMVKYPGIAVQPDVELLKQEV